MHNFNKLLVFQRAINQGHASSFWLIFPDAIALFAKLPTTLFVENKGFHLFQLVWPNVLSCCRCKGVERPAKRCDTQLRRWRCSRI